MKRKVNRVGQNTLTVSLPSKWVKENNIRAGSELEIFEKNKELIISSQNIGETNQKNVNLNVGGFSKFMLIQFLNEAYLEGSNEIILNFSKKELYDYDLESNIDIRKFVKDYISRFMGLEVISQKSDQIVLQNLTFREDISKIDNVKKRIFFMIREFLKEFSISINENQIKKFYNDAEDYNVLIVRFINHYLNLLNSSNYLPIQKIRLFSLFSLIENAIERIGNMVQIMAKMSSLQIKTKKYLNEMFELFTEYFFIVDIEAISPEKIEVLINKRHKLLKRISLENFSPKEHTLIRECRIIFDILNDFIQAYFSINMNRYATQKE